jgi:hypothetical protein
LQCLDPTDDLPVLIHLEPTERLKARMRPPTVTGGLPLGAVTCNEQDLVEPLTGLEPRAADPAF